MYEITFEYADAVTIALQFDQTMDVAQAIDKAFEYADAMRPDAEPVKVTLEKDIMPEIMARLKS